MKIAMIYTGAVIIPSITARMKQQFPQHEIINILDDSLVGACIKDGCMTQETRRRLCHLYEYAYDLGAEYIVNTCSSVGESIALGKELVPIPLVRIDQALAETAVKVGRNIGVIGTLNSTLEPTCNLISACAKELGKEISIVEGLAKGAYEAACSGQGDVHDQLISDTAKSLAAQCDVIVLAQASMERMEQKLQEETGITVLSSPPLFFDRLRETLA